MSTSRKGAFHQLTKAKVARQLSRILKEMKQAERAFHPVLSSLHDHFKWSGTNLIHYLVLRSNEIRELQEYLHHVGLSSMTNSESHTFAQLQNVLGRLMNKEQKTHPTACTFETASRLQLLQSKELLAVFPVEDRPHIMVTFSSELMQDRKLVEEMLNEGMSVARINCAHDTPEIWLNMISVLHKAIAKTGKQCKIYMDIAGPKIRIKRIEAVKEKDNLRLPVSEGKELVLQYEDHPSHGHTQRKHPKKDILFIEPKELLPMIKEGEHIFFDDGKFEAKVIKVEPGKVTVRIIRISAKKHILKPEKGINLPDSEITIPH